MLAYLITIMYNIKIKCILYKRYKGVEKMYLVAAVDDTKCMGCIGCKICIKTCPEANATKFMTPKKKVAINPMRCKGCGLCVDVCPMKCITLNSI